MTDQQDVEVSKAAAAGQAAGNHGAGLDGDGPSAADDAKAVDPVTGSSDHATGDHQAALNTAVEPPA